jgi:hypothetical protein
VIEGVTRTERNRGRFVAGNEGKRKKRGRREKRTPVRIEGRKEEKKGNRLKRTTYTRHDKMQRIKGRRRT